MKKIRNLSLENPFFLAPMADVNDIAFRILCKQAGCGLTYTGMINPLNPKEIDLEDAPAIQIFCTSTKGVKEFIKKHESKAALFDFNLGCPAKTAKKLGFGSFLHNKLETIEEILKEMRLATEKPITIKLRKSPQALKIIKIAEKYCDAICIHPRTQQQGYGGEPDLKFAEQIKKRTKLPVIYSGNVNAENATALLKKFDFLMVGRAALGHPEIFQKLNMLLGEKVENRSGGELINYREPLGNHKIRAKRNFAKQEESFGFRAYLALAKKHHLYFRHIKTHAMYFTLGKEDAKDIRREIAKAKTIQEIEKLI